MEKRIVTQRYDPAINRYARTISIYSVDDAGSKTLISERKVLFKSEDFIDAPQHPLGDSVGYLDN